MIFSENFDVTCIIEYAILVLFVYFFKQLQQMIWLADAKNFFRLPVHKTYIKLTPK